MTTNQADAILAALIPVVDGMATTLGPHAEVVLHDFRKPDSSIIAIAGTVTNRHVGGSMSEIGMELLARGDEAANELNYLIMTTEGRHLRSSTFPLRDSRGALIGALCINLDVTEIEKASSILSALACPQAATETPVTFTDDIADVVDTILAAAEAAHGRPDQLDRKDRLILIRELDQRGVFNVRNAAQRVANHLGISRASLYADLQGVRGKEPAERQTA